MPDPPEIVQTAVKQSRTALGIMGENLARRYLERKKCNIVDHNFRCPLGEIDLVARKDRAYRFIEVKYRRTPEYGVPQESVVQRKRRRVRNAAVVWLKRRRLPLDSEIHFDVVAITEQAGEMKYEYIEDAF
jgi:putative endonuclease